MSSVASKLSNVPDEGLLLTMMEKCVPHTHTHTHTRMHTGTHMHAHAQLFTHTYPFCPDGTFVSGRGRWAAMAVQSRRSINLS